MNRTKARMKMAEILIRTKEYADNDWISELLRTKWASVQIVTRGKSHDATKLPAFLAVVDGSRAGLVTYRAEKRECQIVSLNSLVENEGIGKALLSAVEREASSMGCRRLWLITTNDNTDALRFYQKRGFRIAALHLGAIRKSRRLKPEIPMKGFADIPILDEIELEKALGSHRTRSPQ